MATLESPALDEAIRNPDNPSHLMVVKDVPRRIRVYAGDKLLADSTNALRVIEFGKSLYDPVIYVPEADLTASFKTVDKTTHCPIKGDASYVALGGEEIGWVYKEPDAKTDRIAAHYAFWPGKTRLVEGD
ncbi:DUF427 domain-containing protein [Roseibium salinum]|uniref:DUF427 domain-containing protein n=1 Tax=Roseibium salinum TaxID=1604349 RepID=A0ABT3R921_9HYPH|nr:DUF427 domain-containing protein [Roseibium sp. DSM 29163]MCX2725498.1 DUF427 domain-containing protein [Roseibium sp. DSM 29163]MDN3720718.1 DUF427 domain-containing protein [Roseibium salinum]